MASNSKDIIPQNWIDTMNYDFKDVKEY